MGRHLAALFLSCARTCLLGNDSGRLVVYCAGLVNNLGKTKGHAGWKMKEAKDILRIVGMVLLVLFVLAVGIPLVLAAAGVALGVIGFLIGLAVAVIKIAIVVAIIYLIIVGIRAVLR